MLKEAAIDEFILTRQSEELFLDSNAQPIMGKGKDCMKEI
jgi:hypothetical protein